MVLTADTGQLNGIGHLLVLEKLLEPSQAIEYGNLATREGVSFPHYLVKNNILLAHQIALVAAQNFAIPMMDINCIILKELPLDKIHKELMQRHAVIPLGLKGTHLYLATDDPSKQSAFNDIQFHTGLDIYLVVVETDKLHLLLQRLDCTNESPITTSTLTLDDTPVITLVDHILLQAIKKEASDIHFEPYENHYRIRYRQDGILHEIASPPAHLASRIAARIKIMSCLDISEKRMPQDGGFKMTSSSNRPIEFRVSTCPTIEGEKVVIRVLDPILATVDMETLGLNNPQKSHFIKALQRPQGMILVTGPTGSGKTMTLYTALNKLNTKEINIVTVEDPVEIKVPGINQVSINPKAGLTFSETLRSFLRQDPDVIMLGEIRDLETAEIALRAAQTGHLVLSTLHTNSAAETLNRLINMGVPSFNVASSISLIIAQRLARMLCDRCKEIRTDFSKLRLIEIGFCKEELETLQLYQAVGCKQCNNGYKGRIGLFEILPISKTLSQLIMANGNALDILNTAQSEGMTTIYQAGLEKIKQGLTSLEELYRVTAD